MQNCLDKLTAGDTLKKTNKERQKPSLLSVLLCDDLQPPRQGQSDTRDGVGLEGTLERVYILKCVC